MIIKDFTTLVSKLHYVNRLIAEEEKEKDLDKRLKKMVERVKFTDSVKLDFNSSKTE